VSRRFWDDDDDCDDAKAEMRAYRAWAQYQRDDTPIEYHASLRTTWEDYQAYCRERQEAEQTEDE
jgi:hypothetical protein